MKIKRGLLIAHVLFLGIAGVAVTSPHPSAAQASQSSSAAKPAPTPSTTATFYDHDALGTTLQLLRSDDNSGCCQASYASSSSHGSSLINTVSTEWNLNLAHQSVRTIYITPNVAIDSLQPEAPPAGYYWDGVTVRSGCFDGSGNVVPMANVVTSSGNCKLGVNFSSAGTRYKLLMSPFPLSGSGDPPPTCPPGGCPSTGVVTVTCNSTSGGQCVNWTIEPNVAAPHANVANLYRFSSTPKLAGTWIFIGQYYNSFRIGLTDQ